MAPYASEWADFEMEVEFWDILRAICEAEGLSDHKFVEQAEDRYPDIPTECAVRAKIIAYLRERSGWMPTDQTTPVHHLHEAFRPLSRSIKVGILGTGMEFIPEPDNSELRSEKTAAFVDLAWTNHMIGKNLDTRNVKVDRGRTTIALEPYFWEILIEISKQEKTTVGLLIQEIDSQRGQTSRASALRLYVVRYLEALATMNGFKSSSDKRISKYNEAHVATRNLEGAGRPWYGSS
jgi:predicted DNA-binding ribbon-helix-helix protein